MPLFDDRFRDDESFARLGKDSCAFYDRSARPGAGPVRRFWSELFDAYPDCPARRTLRERLWTTDEVEASVLTLEFLMHGTLRLGFRAPREQPVLRISGRPDFSVTGDNTTFFVEATVAESSQRKRQRDETVAELRECTDAKSRVLEDAP